MGVAVGSASIFGFAEESAYGTVQAPSRFVEFVPGETLERRVNFIQPQGIGGSTTRNARRGSKRVQATEDAGGAISFEVQTRQFGLVFKHLLGGTPTIVQQGSTAAWLQTHTLGTVADRSLTLQKQLRDAAGTAVKTLTYLGSILTAGEFTINPSDGLLRLALDVDARREVDTEAAAAASFVDSDPFTYRQGTLLVGGVAVPCANDARVRVENPMVLDRYCLGNAGVKNRPVDSDKPLVTGSFTADFDASTYYDLFKNNTPASLSLSFVGALIATGHYATLTISIPEIRVSGESPKIPDTGLIRQNVTFGGWQDPAGDPAITITYKSLDVSV